MADRSFRVVVAALTHRGALRTNNEDTLAIGETVIQGATVGPRVESFAPGTSKLLVVADGMGGHAAGEHASLRASERLVELLEAGVVSEPVVRDALRDANRTLYDAMAEHREFAGMGTTVAGVLVGARETLAFNVGDSRVYRLAGGSLEQVSIDDSEATPFWAPGLIRNPAITQCLGGKPGFEDIAPHICRHATVPGEVWLVCSDGLTDLVGDPEIEVAIDADLAASATRLFDLAMRAGGRDNISILLARIESE